MNKKEETPKRVTEIIDARYISKDATKAISTTAVLLRRMIVKGGVAR